MKTVTKYVANDGKEFDNQHDAQQHERVILFLQALEDYGISSDNLNYIGENLDVIIDKLYWSGLIEDQNRSG